MKKEKIIKNSVTMDAWEDLRRRARTLEADIDHKLIAFNRLSVSQVWPALLVSMRHFTAFSYFLVWRKQRH